MLIKNLTDLGIIPTVVSGRQTVLLHLHPNAFLTCSGVTENVKFQMGGAVSGLNRSAGLMLFPYHRIPKTYDRKDAIMAKPKTFFFIFMTIPFG